MNVIEIEIKNKIAKTTSDVQYVCGNSDYLIRFSFDEEWDQYETKTARVVNGDGEYHDVVFTGCECDMPIISNAYAIKIGVFAGNLHTTTPAYVPAIKSILCGAGTPADPPEDVYNQIMERLNSSGGTVSPEQIREAVEMYMAEHPAPYVLPVATADTLGGVRVGEGLRVAEDGTVSAKVNGYKLLASYKFNETMAGITIDEIDGVPLNLKAMAVIFDRIGDGASAIVTSNVWYICRGSDGSKQHVKGGYFQMAGAQGNCWSTRAEIDGDFISVESAAMNANTNAQVYNGHANVMSEQLGWRNYSGIVLPITAINGIYFTVENSVTPGSRMWIYGKGL